MLLTNALRSGMSASEFWQLTPRETGLALEAAAWRMERERERSLWQAWHIAALGRTKTLPKLHRLLHPPETRALTGEEKEVRQREFEEMKRRFKAPTPGPSPVSAQGYLGPQGRGEG